MKKLIALLLMFHMWLTSVYLLIVVFCVNCLHYNPWGINEDLGAQLLLVWIAFMAFYCACLFANLIVSLSTYEDNRYYLTKAEMITTYGEVFGPIRYLEQFPLWWSVEEDRKNEADLNAFENQPTEY